MEIMWRRAELKPSTHMQTNNNKSKLKSPLKMFEPHCEIGKPRRVSHVFPTEAPHPALALD